jgi:hypothetical protein
MALSQGAFSRVVHHFISVVKSARLLLVCHCERDAGNLIRIISARKATKRESNFYGGEQP